MHDKGETEVALSLDSFWYHILMIGVVVAKWKYQPNKAAYLTLLQQGIRHPFRH